MGLDDRVQQQEEKKQTKTVPLRPDFMCVYIQVKNEGVVALYSGLSAALARQASYTTLRLGLYDVLKRLVLDRESNFVRTCRVLCKAWTLNVHEFWWLPFRRSPSSHVCQILVPIPLLSLFMHWCQR